MSKKSDKDIPEVNIGLVGHVDTGKTTLVQALTGKWTDTHSEELRRGITIRLGYADVQVKKCESCGEYTTKDECEECEEESHVVRTISLVDAPGHETLMANVLSGAAIMDGALLLISADEPCPQPQTREHLAALNIIGIDNIIVVQNKIDTVSKDRAKESYNEIKEFIEGTIAEDAPIIPISAQYSTNIEKLLENIEQEIPTPKRNSEVDPKLLIARSFDINKPGTKIENLHGGILGGSLVEGELESGEVEIRPGIKKKNKWEPLDTEITSIRQGEKSVEKGKPGGLLAVETNLDPSLSKSDGLAGNVLGKKGEMPPVFKTLEIKTHLMDRIVGTEGDQEVENIKGKESLMLNIGTAKSAGVVKQAGNVIKVNLRMPVCAEEGDRVSISRRMGSRWRLIGHGIIKSGKELDF